MQAQDIMTKDVIFAAADTTVDQITTLMMESHQRGADPGR